MASWSYARQAYAEICICLLLQSDAYAGRAKERARIIIEAAVMREMSQRELSELGRHHHQRTAPKSAPVGPRHWLAQERTAENA